MLNNEPTFKLKPIGWVGQNHTDCQWWMDAMKKAEDREKRLAGIDKPQNKQMTLPGCK